jgi:hypothetical protein
MNYLKPSALAIHLQVFKYCSTSEGTSKINILFKFMCMIVEQNITCCVYLPNLNL